MTEQEKQVQKALGTLEKYEWIVHIQGKCGDPPFEKDVDTHVKVVGYDQEDALKEAIKILVIGIKNKKYKSIKVEDSTSVKV